MNLMKRNLKRLVSSLGYEVKKLPSDEWQLLQFGYQHGWLKQFAIAVIVDIGANEGQFARKFTYLYPNAKLICFEPLKEPFARLRQNLKHVPNAIFNNFALGASEDELSIYVNEYKPHPKGY